MHRKSSNAEEQPKFDNSNAKAEVQSFRKTIAGILISFFVLTFCVTYWIASNLSTAWFANSNSVFANGMSVTVQEPNYIQVDLENFITMGYLTDNGVDADPRYTFDSKKYSELSGGISMVPYDTIQNDNALTPLVIKLPVRGHAVETGATLHIELSIDNNDLWYTTAESGKKQLANILSNILEISCVVSNSEAEGEALWAAVTNITPENLQTYVTWSEENPQKTNTLSFDISGYTAPAENEYLNLYFIINYNAELVRVYTDKHNESIKFGDTIEEIKFDNDFSALNITFS